MKKICTPFFLWYLKTLAKIQLAKIHPRVVGVGGSSGKTSTAHLIYLIISKKYKVRPSEGRNSETGIPLTILGLDPKSYRSMDWILLSIKALAKVLFDFKKFEILVAEMGIDGPKEPKNMGYLLKIIKPNVSVLTNISLEHSIYFDELISNDDIRVRKEKITELIRDDEIKIVTQINKNSSAIINMDDPNIWELRNKIEANQITVSEKNKTADFFIEKFDSSLQKTELNFRWNGKSYSLKIDQPLPFFYSYSIMFSIAAAQSVGVLIDESIEILSKNFSLPPGRFSVFKGIKESVIFDSTYNNSIEAITGILEFISSIANKRRRLGIIGDIREQGKQSSQIHEVLAEKIMENLDSVILIGENNLKYTSLILEKNKFRYKAFMTFTEARKDILDEVEENDLVVIKGSQNKILLERAVELLLKNKEDIEKLTRRGKFWDKIREATA